MTYLSYLNTKKSIEIKNKNWVTANELSLDIITTADNMASNHINHNKNGLTELVKYQLLAYSSFLESSMMIYKDYGKRLCDRFIKKGQKLITKSKLNIK
jgi:hypothetical protein